MAWWKAVGKLAKGFAKIGGKTVAKTAGVAYKGVAAGAGTIYKNREAIKAGAIATAKAAGKTAVTAERLAYEGTAADRFFVRLGRVRPNLSAEVNRSGEITSGQRASARRMLTP